MPQAVVLPEPCRPTSITTVGGFGFIGELAAVAAEGGDELVVDDLDDLLRGRRLLDRSASTHCSLMRDEALDDLEVDVGLEQGEADLTEHLVDLGSPRRPLPRRRLKIPLEAIGQRIEHGRPRLPGRRN